MQHAHDLLWLAFAVVFKEEECFFSWDFDDLQVSLIHRIARYFKIIIGELHFYCHLMPAYHLISLYLYAFQFALGNSVTRVPRFGNAFLVVGEVELIMRHSLYHTFVVLPVLVQLIQIEGRLFALQPSEKSFVLLINELLLFFPVNLVQAVMVPAAAIPTLFGVTAPLAHDTFYLHQQHSILPLNFNPPHFLELLLLAPIDDHALGVLHQSGCNRLHLLHVHLVVAITDQQFFVFGELVEVGPRAIHEEQNYQFDY